MLTALELVELRPLDDAGSDLAPTQLNTRELSQISEGFLFNHMLYMIIRLILQSWYGSHRFSLGHPCPEGSSRVYRHAWSKIP